MRAHWVIAALWATPAAAVTCEDLTFEGHSLTACTVAASEDLRLFHRDDAGGILGGFSAVEDHAGGTLAFAMNAGMYHDDRAPVGLYREDGKETQRLITSDGPGNFGLLPNGVFCFGDGSLRVMESLKFQSADPTCPFATQSGPMLVIDGALHPRFIPGGSSKFTRNGVGTTTDGQTAVFVIANDPVNFHTFGRVFRDVLGLSQALYFDGKVSRLYAPDLGRADIGFQLGPIVGVVE